jgi:hypothetical protein
MKNGGKAMRKILHYGAWIRAIFPCIIFTMYGLLCPAFLSALSIPSVDLLVTVTPSRLQTVDVGTGGTFTFRMENVGETYSVIKIKNITPAFNFVSGDRNKEIDSVSLIGANYCHGSGGGLVAGEGPCVYGLDFTTSAIGSPEQSKSALWRIFTDYTGTLERRETVWVKIRSIPEPATFVLLCSGTLGLLGYGWRKNKRGE